MNRPSTFSEGPGRNGCCHRLLLDSWALMSDSTSCRRDKSIPQAACRKAARSVGPCSSAAPNSSLILSHSCFACTCFPLNLSQQPSSCHTPVALHGCRRNLENRCRLLDCQSCEETQLHNPALLKITLRKLLQGVVKGEYIHIFVFDRVELVMECDLA